MFLGSAWHGQHFSQRHGISAASHEHGDLQHRQSQEAPPEQRGEQDCSGVEPHAASKWPHTYSACALSSRRAQGKMKADRNRARVEENFLKQTHAQRQEAAQTRREEKKRAEKERIMSEEDPERQRRLEVREGTHTHTHSPSQGQLDLFWESCLLVFYRN